MNVVKKATPKAGANNVKKEGGPVAKKNKPDEIKTDILLSEKDEVEAAEARMRKIAKSSKTL